MAPPNSRRGRLPSQGRDPEVDLLTAAEEEDIEGLLESLNEGENEGRQMAESELDVEENGLDIDIGSPELVSDLENGADALVDIKVKQLDEADLTLYGLERTDLVLELKQKIFTHVGLPIDLQRIIYKGKVLENTRSLQFYGLENNDCVHLVRKARTAPTMNVNNFPDPFRLTRANDLSPEDARVPLRNLAAGASRTQENAARNRANETANVGVDMGELGRLIQQNLHVPNAAVDGRTGPRLTAVPVPGQSTTTNGNRSGRLGRPFPVGDNVEHIYQALATLETIDSTLTVKDTDTSDTELVGNEIISNEPDHERTDRVRTFKVGQWVDCLDTVNQWLEATIIAVSRDGRKIRVHYNGWGTRWDETLPADSNRIARFRTKTKNSHKCGNFSPTISHWIETVPKLNVDFANDDNEDTSNEKDVSNRVVQTGMVNKVKEKRRRMDRPSSLKQANNMDRLIPTVYQSANKLLPQMKKLFEADYATADDKIKDILTLAPKLDLLGRVLIDLGQHLADKPLFRRREKVLVNPVGLVSWVKVPVLPYGLKASREKDKISVGLWNRKQREELIRTMNLDGDILNLVNKPNEITAPSSRQQPRVLELHVHTIIAPSISESNAQGTQTSNRRALPAPDNDDEEADSGLTGLEEIMSEGENEGERVLESSVGSEEQYQDAQDSPETGNGSDSAVVTSNRDSSSPMRALSSGPLLGDTINSISPLSFDNSSGGVLQMETSNRFEPEGAEASETDIPETSNATFISARRLPHRFSNEVEAEDSIHRFSGGTRSQSLGQTNNERRRVKTPSKQDEVLRMRHKLNYDITAKAEVVDLVLAQVQRFYSYIEGEHKFSDETRKALKQVNFNFQINQKGLQKAIKSWKSLLSNCYTDGVESCIKLSSDWSKLLQSEITWLDNRQAAMNNDNNNGSKFRSRKNPISVGMKYFSFYLKKASRLLKLMKEMSSQIGTISRILDKEVDRSATDLNLNTNCMELFKAWCQDFIPQAQGEIVQITELN